MDEKKQDAATTAGVPDTSASAGGKSSPPSAARVPPKPKSHLDLEEAMKGLELGKAWKEFSRGDLS